MLIDLSWNSSRLEGNTYSLLETERLIELGEQAEGRSVTEAQMILNHKAAIELLVEQAEEIGFNHYTICGLHALLSDNLLADPRACGRIRGKSIGITGSVYHPADGEKYVEELFQLLLRKGKEINDPFEQSFFAMVHIPYLQPFEDVNKRVSRLAANIPLIRRNLVPSPSWMSLTKIMFGQFSRSTNRTGWSTCGTSTSGPTNVPAPATRLCADHWEIPIRFV